LYLPLCDSWIVYDNSEPTFKLVAECMGTEAVIYEPEIWERSVGGTND